MVYWPRSPRETCWPIDAPVARQRCRQLRRWETRDAQVWPPRWRPCHWQPQRLARAGDDERTVRIRIGFSWCSSGRVRSCASGYQVWATSRAGNVTRSCGSCVLDDRRLGRADLRRARPKRWIRRQRRMAASTRATASTWSAPVTSTSIGRNAGSNLGRRISWSTRDRNIGSRVSMSASVAFPRARSRR